MTSLKKITFFTILIVLIILSWFITSTFQSSVSTQPNRQFPTNLHTKELSNNFFPKPLHITAIGDSLTKGVGDETNQGGYLKYLQSDLLTLKSVKNVEIENFGVTGHRTIQLLDRMENETVKKSIQHADVVLITIGGNDMMKIVKDNFLNLQLDVFEAEIDNYEKRLNTILKTVRKNNTDAKIVLIGLYNPFLEWFSDIEEFQTFIDEWNATSKSVLNRYKDAYFVDISDVFLHSEENLLYEDHFHPNNRGYELIASKVFATFQSHIEVGGMYVQKNNND